MASDPVLFALPPSEQLGERVARELGIALSPFELRRFADGEEKIRSGVTVRGLDAYVVCSLYGDLRESVHDRLCRLMFFVASLRDAGAFRIAIVAPYLCYARKDRRTNPRDPVTTRYLAAIIESIGADRVITIDVHNLAAFENAFRIRREHLEATELFVGRCRELTGELAVVSPDPGGFHRAECLRDALERDRASTVEIAMLGKHRHADVVRTGSFVGDVEGRAAVIVDDVIVTGTTLVRAAEVCRGHGATAVHAMATHAMFTTASQQLLVSPTFDSIVVTDTVSPERMGTSGPRVELVSVAPLVANAIRAIHEERSVTELVRSHRHGIASSERARAR